MDTDPIAPKDRLGSFCRDAACQNIPSIVWRVISCDWML